MKKIRITTPATTANLGPGFDYLGLALTLYNEMSFELSNKDEEIGFNGVGENGALIAFHTLIKKYNHEEIKVKIELIQNDIPVARGLGSSASAIVSGCVAANYFMNNLLSEDQLINEMVLLEGHPDNILPCYYGGLVTSIQEDQLIVIKKTVNEELYFNCLIPAYKVKTSDARKVLPQNYNLHDVTFNASRAFVLAEALEKGDIKLIKVATQDRIHEPYRKQFIQEWDTIKAAIVNQDAVLNISGSGPTMLLISKEKEIINKIKKLELILDIKQLKTSKKGVELVECKGEKE